MNKAISNLNYSEAQLFEFLSRNDKKDIEMSLKPQGDNTLIQKEAINLCVVEIEDNVYLFGGIREEVYDHFVILYDHREQTEQV